MGTRKLVPVWMWVFVFHHDVLELEPESKAQTWAAPTLTDRH